MASVFNPAPLGDIGHVIQLAIAPVFLLTAIATILNAYEVRRTRLIYLATSMAVFAALLVAALISLAFIDPFVELNFTKLIAVLFILAMVALVAALAILLREIFYAVNSPRTPIV